MLLSFVTLEAIASRGAIVDLWVNFFSQLAVSI